MDHLPLPDDTPLQHIQVPYYTCAEYKYTYSGPWASYHRRHGFDASKEFYPRQDRPYPARLKPRLAAFVQSWLWFGLLQEFLNEELRVEEWTAPFEQREGEGEGGEAAGSTLRISTCGLLARLDRWAEAIREKSDVDRAAELKAVDFLLHDAERSESHFELSPSNFLEVWDVLPESLLLSLNILVNTLKIARNAAFVQIPPLPRHPGIIYDVTERAVRLGGWCPVAVNAVAQSCDAVSQYCVSRLGPVESPQDHVACSADLCSALQVDHQTYQTRHVDTECRCDMSQPLGSLVATALQAKNIPTIRLNEDNCSLEIATSDLHELSFVAISHVWSDGLGNLSHNSLPLCQLRRIQTQVNGAMKTRHPKSVEEANTFFWIDTICVPVGDDFRDERNYAISQMVHVYREASVTLVLNAELKDIPSCTASWELSARINRTAWFRRLWTLHEGIISPTCLFQLKDKAIEFPELTERPPSHRSAILSKIEESIIGQTSRMYSNMQTFKSLSKVERSREIWTAFKGKTTSNADDETICLSNMLGLDLAPILAIDRFDPDVCSKRMKAFILQQKDFPQGLIFDVQAGKDFKSFQGTGFREPGFRWAPRTFVFDQWADYGTSHQSLLATADARGLHAKFPGILPNVSWENFFRLTRRDTVLLKLPDPSMRALIMEISFMVPGQWDYHYTLQWEMPSPWHLDGSLLRSTRPALVLEEDLISQELDERELEDGQKLREFSDDLSLGIERAALTVVLEREVNALLVGVPLEKFPVLRHDIGKASDEIEVLIVGYVTVLKTMFETRQKPACNQVSFGKKVPAEKLASFETLPVETGWCIR